LLSVVAGIALALALITGYIDGALLDPNHFAHRATVALDDSAVRSDVAGAVTDAISGGAGGAIPAAQVTKAVDGVIAEPKFGSQFRAALVKVHTALVENGDSSATLQLSGIGPLVAKRLGAGTPGMLPPGAIPPVKLQIKPPGAVSSVVSTLHSLSWLPAVLGLLALVLFAFELVRADDRGRALRRIGITTLVCGVVLVAIYFIAREVAVNGTGNSGVAGAIASAYFGDFAIASLVLAAAGALAWWGAAHLSSARRVVPAPAATVAADAAPLEPDESVSDAATRVLASRRVTRQAATEPEAAPVAQELPPERPARVDEATVAAAPPPPAATKTCPDCAETVLAAARVCKHCGYRFERGA
jgi:hypothetical protein